jgi:hypothetical protein
LLYTFLHYQTEVNLHRPSWGISPSCPPWPPHRGRPLTGLWPSYEPNDDDYYYDGDDDYDDDGDDNGDNDGDDDNYGNDGNDDDDDNDDYDYDYDNYD